jgi:uncharacterized membrane protein
MIRFRTSCLATILVMSTKSWAQDAAIAGSGASPKEMAKPVLEWTATGIEVVGVAVILLGVVAATIVFLRGGFSQDGWPQAFRDYRANLGRGILLGLELLVAADIIGTVAVTPSLENLAVLAVIVLIRTFLSFSLEVEIEGRWPWQRNRDPGRSA